MEGRDMEDPLRVLIVDHHLEDRRIAEHLLTDYDLDFSWRCVASPRELRQVAADFDPNIVLCTADMSMTSRHALLDALRLLCAQTPVILVSSVREMDPSAVRNTTAPFPNAVRPSLEEACDHAVPDAAPSQYGEDIVHLRRCFSSLLESSSNPAVMSNADGWITHANTSACRGLDGPSERSIGTLLSAPFEQQLRCSNRIDVSQGPNQRDDCSSVPVAVAPHSALAGHGVHGLAYFDAWTHHPTLIHVHDLIRCVTGRKDDSCTASALVALNLDSLRIPEERLPQATGADMQSEVARHGSIVRIAPDDFLLVLPPLSSAGEAAIIAHRVLESIAQIRLTADLCHPATGAPDIVSVPTNGRPFERDLIPAGASMPHSDLHRRDRRLSNAIVEPRTVAKEHLQLGVNLGDAIQRHALSIQYQPQFELHSGRGCGVEALARWTLSTGQLIAPSVFIPLAERLGMIHALGAWVLKSACETAYAWCSRDAQRTTLSVNVSAHQINEEFCTVIGRTLKESRFPAKHLELEITESALVGNTEVTIECLKEWKRLGVQIAVDDFGTGYSSLNYLSRLPVDRLKLDQSLIQRMTLDAKSKTVMRSIISLGADLGIDVIAEGVETEHQFQMLEDLGCPRVQGYLLGRPMPPKQAQLALRKAWGNRPGPRPVFRPTRVAAGECLVQ
jgi:EAL domain-containing protein (putative c-di-GMP-specific phosphodiesterase class I)/CheY-like chemotaxis protein